MAYQNHNHKHHNRNHYGWWSPSNEYRYETTAEPAYPRHHHKGQVAFGSNYEEPTVEAYPKAREPETEANVDRYQRARFGDHIAFESVDQEAEAFIQYEHKRWN